MSPAPPLRGAARQGWDSLLADPTKALLAFDFDGTLSPIVDDPERAYAHPDVIAVLGRLGTVVGAVAVVTGRPVASVLRLAEPAGVPGLESLVVLGQYGIERWDAATGEFAAPPPPGEIARVRDALPGLLADLDLAAARIEDKGRAVAVHVRTSANPVAALERLRVPLALLAAEHGLILEPGRLVLEMRPPGMDKGQALLLLVAERRVSTVVYAGDDLGDLAAYDAVDAWRGEGRTGLLICSASAEQDALSRRADVVVPGPDGLVRWLAELADQLGV